MFNSALSSPGPFLTGTNTELSSCSNRLAIICCYDLYTTELFLLKS